MEDTLRYFFSAVFQGFAAILTLGTMYYLYFNDRANRYEDLNYRDMKIILDRIKGDYPDTVTDDKAYKFATSYIENNRDGNDEDCLLLEELVKDLKAIDNDQKEVQILVPTIIKKSIEILAISLTALFTVGYFSLVNYVLFLIGIYIILQALTYFKLIKKFITITTHIKIH